jgi:hypothetical protein
VIDERGEVGEMRIGRGNRSIRRKPVTVLLCSGYDSIVRGREAVPNLLEINYKFCKIEFVK